MAQVKVPRSFDELISDLYGSLSEEICFEDALHRLGAAFGSNISALHMEDFGLRQGSLSLVGDINAQDYAHFSQTYSNRWNGQNLWMERSLDGFMQQGYQHGEAVAGDTELLKTPYYQHFLKPLNIRFGLGICVWSDEKLNMAVAAFHRGHAERGFDAYDIALVEKIRPHLVNVYAIYRRFAKMQQSLVSLRAGFDRTPLGMLMLDTQGRLLECYAAAEVVLFSTTAIRRGVDGFLNFASSNMKAAFNRAIKHFTKQPAMPISIPLYQSGGGGESQLVMHFCSLPPRASLGVHRECQILVFIAELQPGKRALLDNSILRDVLGISATEARVAMGLRQHIDVAALSALLGLSASNTRTHLRNIHTKLGVRRNGDLVAMIERLIGSVPLTSLFFAFAA